MAGQEDRRAAAIQLQQQLADLGDALRVEPVGRLVEDQQFRTTQQRTGQPQPLPHAQRVRPDRPAADAGQPDLLEHLHHPGLPGPPSAARAGSVQDRQILPAGQVAVGGRTLDQRTHPRQHAPALARHPRPEHLDLAGGRQDEAEQHPDGRRLARAVGAQEAVDVARPDVEVDAVDGPDPPVALDQPAGRDDRCHGQPLGAGSSRAAWASASSVTVPVSRYDVRPVGASSRMASGPAVSRVPSSSATAAGSFSRRVTQVPAGAAGQRHDGQQGDAAAVQPDRLRRSRNGAPRQSGQGRRERDPGQLPAGVRDHVGVTAQLDPGARRRREGGDLGSRRGEIEVQETGVDGRGARRPCRPPAPAAAARWPHRPRRPPTRWTTPGTRARSGFPVRSRPATRRAPIRDSSPGSASDSNRRPSVVGSRSSGAGTDNPDTGVQVARLGSYSHRPAAGGLAVDVGLTADRDDVHPVVGRATPPHPHGGAIAEQVGDGTELIGDRKREPAGRLGVPGEADAVTGQHRGAELGGGTVGVRDRPHRDDQRQRHQDGDRADDEAPTPRCAVPACHTDPPYVRRLSALTRCPRSLIRPGRNIQPRLSAHSSNPHGARPWWSS